MMNVKNELERLERRLVMLEELVISMAEKQMHQGFGDPMMEGVEKCSEKKKQ